MPLLLQYTPATGEGSGRTESHQFSDDVSVGDVFLTAVGWLHSWRGTAVVTCRDGKQVKLTHTVEGK